MKKTIATLTTLAALVLVPAANAAFGDNFGVTPINDGPGPLSDAPAFEPATDAYWAGACRIADSPGPGGAVPAPGMGTRPSTILAPNASGFTGAYGIGAAPPTPPHCIDWGGYTGTGSRLWTQTDPGGAPNDRSPAWRLPATTQAGAHAEGSLTFYMQRAGTFPEGTLDNVWVDLPAGFVGDPGAVPKCTGQQFASKPVQCPPETQVGVLHLNLVSSIAGNYGGAVGGDLIVDPVFNLEPREGNAAELGIANLGDLRFTTDRLVAKARTNGDFGVTTFVGQIPAALPVVSQMITIWGVPWEATHDRWRASQGYSGGSCATQSLLSGGGGQNSIIPVAGFTVANCAQSYRPSWGPIRPFISTETDCNPGPVTDLAVDSFQNPGAFISDGRPIDSAGRNADPDFSDPDWKRYFSPSPAVDGCEKLGFDPAITLDPKLQGGAENKATDTPSGLDVELRIPQNNELPFATPPDGSSQPVVDQYVADATDFWTSDAGLATAHLKDTVVTLPEGMTLNPAAADGQGACTMEQIGVTDLDSPEPPSIRFDNSAVRCPDNSKVGEVVVETPLLEPADWPEGSVYLAAQGDNPFNSDFAIYIAIESPDRGLIAKLAGRVEPDPSTGRLTTTFVENPELPFDVFRLRFKAGPRAPLATPTVCATHTNESSFTSHARPNDPVAVPDPFQIDSSPAGSCPASRAERPLGIGFSAGSTELVAGAHSPFTVRLTRPDGHQEFDRVEVTTPEGLVAKLAGVPYCSDAAIAAASARTATGEGRAEQASPSCPAASQVGTTTIGAGAGSQPIFVRGNVYLAGPYKGAPISLAFIVPAVAGPFDLGVQVVRTALNINPRTTQVTAVSDSIPQILRGVPVRLRDIRVDIDRPGGFTLNPTDCSAQFVTGKVFGSSGAIADVSNRFQVANCANLPFKPKLVFRLRGGTKRGKYPQFTATLNARPGDANIASVSAALPRSEFLANEHIRTICTRPDFAADNCPAGAIYGEATAWSPLLDEPLTGPVYLRASSNLLPDLVPDLRGPAHQPIKVELAGRTDSIRGGIRNTFDVVPDAPVTRFVLRMQGGNKGLLVNSRNICARTYRATVEMQAQNGRTLTLKPKLRAQCKRGKKKGKKGAKGKRRGHKRGR